MDDLYRAAKVTAHTFHVPEIRFCVIEMHPAARTFSRLNAVQRARGETAARATSCIPQRFISACVYSVCG